MCGEAWVYGTTSHDSREILTLNEVHFDEKVTRDLAILIDRDDPSVGAAEPLLQLGSQSFGIENLLIFWLRAFVDNFQRDFVACLRIVSEENLAHRAPPNQSNDVVLPVPVTGIHG